MRKKLPKILITGSAGFIGSAFVRLLVRKGLFPERIIIVDKLSYAADLKRIEEAGNKFKFYRSDICNKSRIEAIFAKEKPDIIVNFAAETHVDRSILNSDEFLRTNVFGTKALLEAAKENGAIRFVQVSTDEVYGDIESGQFHETTPLNPSSPYSASKASADLLVRSYIRTYNFPAIIVRPSNNYGNWQYPEKLVPVIIYKALKNEKIPVYSKGLNVREWLYVDDCAQAILKVVRKGKIGEVYNIGSGSERKNIEVVRRILDILDKPYSLIQFVRDRPGHDLRYSLNSSKIRKELGWKPQMSFDKGLEGTVEWYKDNISWLEGKVKYLKAYWKKVYKSSS